MKAIVCADKNWGIGFGNDLLYHIPADMKFFKEKTVGNVTVMGLATFLSLPGQQPLKDRTNIVLAADDSFYADGIIICRTMDELFKKLGEFDTERVFVCGGASIYEQLLPYCDTAYVTKVNDGSRQAEKYFPNLDEKPEWRLTYTSEPVEYKDLTFAFTTYTKQRS